MLRYLDYLSVATYDYTGPYDSKTGYNSPLYSRSQEKNSVVFITLYFIRKNAKMHQLSKTFRKFILFSIRIDWKNKNSNKNS